MAEIGTYEAKTHFAKLLERVSRGERITILRHGVPIAVLAPPEVRADDVDETIEELRALRRDKRLNGLSVRELVEGGRR